MWLVDFALVLPDLRMLVDEPFFAAAEELLDAVVVAVSVLLWQEAKKARPSTQTMEVRRDFFIGYG
ncbi:MAG TPA: hypothetical protein VK474_05250 [Chthoniobacterales bacterium]|nr:hypothetical protein [Chthoniobacterales bacterium]